jgi:integrase
MRPGEGRRKPTLHGLRHFFAVERLTKLSQQGTVAEDLAPNLSIYMGHVSPAESYWYLTSTPALLRTAADSFKNYAAFGVIYENFGDSDWPSSRRVFR